MMLFARFCIREMIIKIRQPKDLVFSFLFFLMSCLFFPLALPIDSHQLQQVAPGLIWFSLIFSVMLSIDQLWQSDYDRGLMTQWFLLQYPLGQIIQAKILVHWLATTIPIVMMLPLIGLLYGLSTTQIAVSMLLLLIGSITVNYLVSLATVFSFTAKQKGSMIALIVLPLILPVLIWGSAIIHLAAEPINIYPYIALTLAGTILSIMLLPWAIAAIIKLQLCENV